MDYSFFLGFALGSLWSVMLLLVNKSRNGKGPAKDDIETVLRGLSAFIEQNEKERPRKR